MKKNTYMRRHIIEGMHNFKRNGRMTVASVSSLALMLFLVGVTFLLLANLNHITTKVENSIEIHVYLENTHSNEQKALSNTILSFGHVSSVKFISKQEGLHSFMKNLGDEGAAFQTLKDENPLNDELVVKTDQPQNVTAVAKKIDKLPLVAKVSYAKNVVGPLMKVTKLARWVGAAFIMMLTFIAVHTVTNTIKITVLARKEEIQLRKLIGATNHFIRFPFFVEGASIGLLSAVIASLLIVPTYYFVYTYVHQSIHLSFIELLAPFPILPFTCLILLIFGALIGIWGAISSLRPILKV